LKKFFNSRFPAHLEFFRAYLKNKNAKKLRMLYTKSIKKKELTEIAKQYELNNVE
jgi:hypothetical protein